MPKRTKIETRIDNERGATAVEFAVIAALLFVIVIAILEFGFIFLQEHLVANAAREGARIGVLANNYDSTTANYNSSTPPGAAKSCYTLTNRALRVHCEVRDYLQDTLYANREPRVLVDTQEVDDIKTLIVTVRADNIFPPILSAFVKTLPGVGDFNTPQSVSYTATGEFEDSEEEF